MLALVAGIVSLLCLGGVGVFISLYDEATEIKRSAPDAVVDNFLGAYLVNRSDQEAELYTCKNPDLTGIAGLRSEMLKREEAFGVAVSVSWESLRVAGSGAGPRSVSADLTIAGSSSGNVVSRRTETWTFDLVDDDGWRVCGSRKVS
ncbi:hypothetical protein [Actinoplanes sp. NPDC051859]|uniref:hypothetical protein n=1 Tax=Actinoplanes sp. NPDC051859 TaxID=3363909 RepID=UPI0037A83C66